MERAFSWTADGKILIVLREEAGRWSWRPWGTDRGAQPGGRWATDRWYASVGEAMTSAAAHHPSLRAFRYLARDAVLEEALPRRPA